MQIEINNIKGKSIYDQLFEKINKYNEFEYKMSTPTNIKNMELLLDEIIYLHSKLDESLEHGLTYYLKVFKF